MRMMINNLKYGKTSRRFAGRIDTEAYNQGADEFTNMISTMQGSARRRPPVKYLCDVGKPERMVSMDISEDLSFLLLFYATGYRTFKVLSDGIVETASLTQYGFTFATGELSKASFTQYYTDLYIAHHSHALMRMSLRVDDTFSFSQPVLILNQDGWFNTDTDLMEGESVTSVKENGKDNFKNDVLNTGTGNFPSFAQIVKERLLLSGTDNNPDTIWISRPFGSSQRAQNENDSILDFIQYQMTYGSEEEMKADADLPRKAVYDSDGNIQYQKPDGFYQWWIGNDGVTSGWTEANGVLKGLLEKDTGGNAITEKGIRLYHKTLGIESDGHGNDKQYTDSDCTVEYPWDSPKHREPYLEYDVSDVDQMFDTIKTVEYVATDSTALKIQLASGRNDRIQWASIGSYLLIGTSSSEWALSGSISALNMQASKISSFGSMSFSPNPLSGSTMFLQRGNILRMITITNDGMTSSNLNLTCDDILKDGVKDFCVRNIPYPAAILVMKDGSMRVMVIDGESGVQSWAEWTFSFNVKAVAVSGNEETEKAFVLCDGSVSDWIGILDEDESVSFKDIGQSGEYQYASRIVLNRFDTNSDSGSTIGSYKKITSVVLRTLDSGKFKAGQVHGDDAGELLETIGAAGTSDYSINVRGGSSKEMRVAIESSGSDPLEILAIGFEIGAN